MPLNPLALIRRLRPSVATKEESALYNALYKDVNARDKAIDDQVRRAVMRAKTPEAQQKLMASQRMQGWERAQNPLKMARSNMFTASTARRGDDETARLLLSTTPDESQHAASMIYRPPGYYDGDRGLPPGALYIEGLSSELPGGGTQMLKELESLYPRTPMVLESVNNPDTLEFYVRKGFLPAPDRSSDAIPRNLFIKPYDVQIRKAGGHVKMAEGGLARLREMVTDPTTYVDAVRHAYSRNPFSATEREHARLYNRLGDELRREYGGKSGSITDRAKNYGGGWDYAMRNPENAARRAELWQFKDYITSPLSALSREDAGHDLDENLAGVRDALRFIGPPEPYEQLKSRAVGWAVRNQRSR